MTIASLIDWLPRECRADVSQAQELGPMNLRQMEVFHAIMTSGTVTGAARLLNISQPAVTGVLRHTEDKLKLRLFERVKGRLEPTPEAHALFAQIESVFDRVDAVRRTIEGLREARVGALDIVAIPAVGATLLPTAIGTFLATHEMVNIRFQMRSRREVVELVASGAADLGFGFLSSDHPRLVAEEIVRDDLICIMPRNHPLSRLAVVSATDLAGYPLISYTSNQGLAPIINTIFAEARVNLRPAVEVGLIMNAWAMVNTGAGIAVVDPHSALDDMFANVVTRPFLPKTPIALEFVRSEDRPVSRLARAFLDHLSEFVRMRRKTAR
jgi:DNA-binding transcriptional LysR family regulator